MGTIKKKRYSVSTTTFDENADGLLSTAAELLGSEWEFTAHTNQSGPWLKKKTPDGYYGWHLGNGGLNAPDLLIKDVKFEGVGTGYACIFTGYSSYTCVVWEGNDGSVGIGQEISGGQLYISLIMAKFTGTYGGHDIYALGNCVAAEEEYCLFDSSGKNIGKQINMSTTIAGTGVYLHPLLDPVTNLYCSDVLGVQCFDNTTYKTCGSIIKQGSVSYMSVLSNTSDTASTNNVLFIKL